jgi:hypothetical protein
MKEYGLDAMTLINHIKTVLKKRWTISENDLTKTYTPQIHSSAKAEAL